MPTTKKQNVAILGGGLTGLSLGAALAAKNMSFRIFEAHSVVGGLARTLRTGDFRWDLGVHALYSKDPDTLQQIHDLPLNYQHSNRKVRICHVRDGRIYPLNYPFENGLNGLPPEDMEECLEGYRKAYEKGRREFANLRDWIEEGLGSGFSRVFMTPYNQKIWNAPLRKISMDLVSGKIDPQPYEQILKNARGGDSVGRSYQAKFVYPKGGIQELCDLFASRCNGNIVTGKAVSGIRKNDDGFSLTFADGDSADGFTRIVSTIPLTRLCHCLPWPEFREKAASLRHNKTLFIMVGLQSGAEFSAFRGCHWSFFAGDEIFYRLTMMHTFSDEFPECCVAEYTIKDNETCDPEAVRAQVVADLLKRGIVRSAEDIRTTDTHIEDFTYPIPTLETKRIKTEIREELKQHGIDLLGRNGRWDYINMDHVLRQVEEFQANFR